MTADVSRISNWHAVFLNRLVVIRNEFAICKALHRVNNDIKHGRWEINH